MLGRRLEEGVGLDDVVHERGKGTHFAWHAREHLRLQALTSWLRTCTTTRGAPAPDHRGRGANEFKQSTHRRNSASMRTWRSSQGRTTGPQRVASTTRCGLATTRRRCAFNQVDQMESRRLYCSHRQSDGKDIHGKQLPRATTGRRGPVRVSLLRTDEPCAFLGDSSNPELGFHQDDWARAIYHGCPVLKPSTRMPRKKAAPVDNAFYTGSLEKI